MQLLWQPCWKWTCICIGIGGNGVKIERMMLKNVFLCVQTVREAIAKHGDQCRVREMLRTVLTGRRQGVGGTSTATHSILKTVCRVELHSQL